MFSASVSQRIKDFIVTRHSEVFYVLEELQPVQLSRQQSIVVSVSIASHIHLPLKKASLGEKSVHAINAIIELEVDSLLLKKQNDMEN